MYIDSVEAKEFKRKRISLGLTQTELAEILDVKPNTVSRYETGTLNISKTVELALEAIEKRMKDEHK
jgi:transcriptional regulator with XRE-family HTH domain